jgi:hypothetical protein
MVLDHLLPSTKPPSFLEWTRTSFEQSLAEFDSILLEEHPQVALEILDVGICSSLQSPKLTSVVILVIMLTWKDAEVHLHALQTVTEHFQLCE